MSGLGRPALAVPTAPGIRVAIAAAQWNKEIVDLLVDRARAVAEQAGTAAPTVVPVPGSMELPVVVQQLATNHDAVVALGVVIRGGTPHFDYVCNAATDGLSRVALDHGIPVGFGLLTCDTEQQALDRAGLEGSAEDKGYEAAGAALATVRAIRGVTES